MPIPDDAPVITTTFSFHDHVLKPVNPEIKIIYINYNGTKRIIGRTSAKVVKGDGDEGEEEQREHDSVLFSDHSPPDTLEKETSEHSLRHHKNNTI